MPVNTLHKDRSIVPDALAFPQSTATRGAGGGSSFQTNLTQTIINNYTIVGADEQYVERRLTENMTAIGNAEARAKYWTSDYQRAFEWSINQSLKIVTNGMTLIGFNEEAIRTAGAHYVNGGAAPSAKVWRFIVPPGSEGIYWIHAHLQMNFTDADGIQKIEMIVRKNLSYYRVIDAQNQIVAGHSPLRDAVLNGGCEIPLQVGDMVDIAVVTTGTSAGFDTLISPSSLYGYVCGHRTRCDMGGTYNEGDGATGTITNDGTSYAFYNG